MGSHFGKQMCCGICGRCQRPEAEGTNEETKPILQSSGGSSVFTDTQPSTPALKVPSPGSKDVQSLSQPRWPPADTPEGTETCPAAEGWEAAWNPIDLFGVPADEEVGVEAEDFTQADNQQEKVGNTEGEIQPAADAQPVGDTAQGAELVADEEQPKEQAEPGSEGALSAGITLQEKNILNLIESGSETSPGQACEMGPPADTGDVLVGRDALLCAVQVADKTEPCLSAEHVEGVDRAKIAEISPRCPQRAELSSLVEALSLLAVQNPSEVIASGVAGLYSASAVSWEALCPEWGFLEPANQLLDFLDPEPLSSVPFAQGMGSCHRAKPVGLSRLLHQASQRVLCPLEEEGSRERDGEGMVEGEAELQHRIVELPEAVTCVPVPVKQEAELLNVPPTLSEVLESSGEMEAENVGA